MASSPSENGNPFAALAAEASSSASSSSGKDGAPLTPEQVENNIQEALACPCIADFRDGPCGPSFVAAFSCFLRSTSSPQHAAATPGAGGSSSSNSNSNSNSGGGGGANAPECLGAFEAMQACMVKHPEAFTDFVKSKEEAEADEDAEESGRGGEEKKR